MYKKFMTLLISGVFFVSCTSMPITGNFRNEIVNFPTINEVMTMTLGDTLVDIGYKKVGEGITIKGSLIDEKINPVFIWTNKKSAHLYTYINRDRCYGLFQLKRIKPKKRSFLDGYDDPNILNYTLCIPNSNKAPLNAFGKKSLYLNHCTILAAGRKPQCIRTDAIWGKNLIENDYLIDMSMNTIEENDNGISQQFIYNGRIGNEIKFIYREFSYNLNRGSFQQEVQYDLNQSNIIGFKELKIEIIEATNQSVTYKVINNFTPKT
ncbi:hypothetical protein N9H74_06185 [Hyphomicrobiales bacterium]|nr:hypothetical protein [Hyphomicrobiales bacterium]